MIVFFLEQKKKILIPNAENKDRTGALWLRNLNLNFFFEKKKDSHYGNQSKVEYCDLQNDNGRLKRPLQLTDD
jgi:hypothetical protein